MLNNRLSMNMQRRRQRSYSNVDNSLNRALWGRSSLIVKSAPKSRSQVVYTGNLSNRKSNKNNSLGKFLEDLSEEEDFTSSQEDDDNDKTLNTEKNSKNEKARS